MTNRTEIKSRLRDLEKRAGPEKPVKVVYQDLDDPDVYWDRSYAEPERVKVNVEELEREYSVLTIVYDKTWRGPEQEGANAL